jgi:putative phosphoesterase
MLLGVLSDIHANRVALDAVFEDMPAVDALVCAGDVVGYNPWPGDCVDALREREVPTVMGNHDRAVARGTAFRFNGMAKAGIDHAERELDEEQTEWLRSLPDSRRVGDVTVVHGHPDDPDRYTHPRKFGPELLDGADALVLGHTHVQSHETFPEGVVLNPGSVGQPRDGDPRAAYALLDTEELTVEERRVEYDVSAVVEAVADAGLPRRTGERLRKGK